MFRSHGKVQLWTQNQHSQVAVFVQTHLWFSSKSQPPSWHLRCCSCHLDACSRKEKSLPHSKYGPSSILSTTWTSNTQESKSSSPAKAQVPHGLAIWDIKELLLPSRTQKVLFYLTKLDWPSYLPVQPPQGSFCLVKFMSSQGHLTNKNTSRKKTPLNLSVLFLGSMPAHIPLLCPSHTDNSSLPLIMHKVMLTGPSGKHKHTRTS